MKRHFFVLANQEYCLAFLNKDRAFLPIEITPLTPSGIRSLNGPPRSKLWLMPKNDENTFPEETALVPAQDLLPDLAVNTFPEETALVPAQDLLPDLAVNILPDEANVPAQDLLLDLPVNNWPERIVLQELLQDVPDGESSDEDDASLENRVLHQTNNPVYHNLTPPSVENEPLKGKPGHLTLRRNFVEQKKKSYLYLGKLVALSILQDGPGLPVFADAVVQYILSGNIASYCLNDLDDALVDILAKMKRAPEGELSDLHASIFDQAIEAGFLISSTEFRKGHIPALQASLIENLVSSCREELEQFVEGLKVHQVLSLLRQTDHIEAATKLFSGQVEQVTPSVVRKLLVFH